jgi:hypothetical protein
VKVYGGYVMPFGTTLSANFYGGSGTPLTTYVTTTNGTRVFAEGRGDMGRTPALLRTDLLASHEISIGGSKRLRAEMNVLNVFNRKVARYKWVWLNRTSPDVRTRPASRSTCPVSICRRATTIAPCSRRHRTVGRTMRMIRATGWKTSSIPERRVISR